MLELHTTSLWAAKIAVCGCSPHPTSCSQLVHLLPQMLLDSSVFAAAIPSESCPVTFAFLIQVTLWDKAGWAIPIPYSEASSRADWTAGDVFFISALFPAGAGKPCLAFFPKVSFFFPHSPLCELFNLPLRNVTVRADECQGWLGSSEWPACQVLHRSPSAFATETWQWCLCSNAST